MTSRQLANLLLEADENIDWSADPDDPDSRIPEPYTWHDIRSIAEKHGFKASDEQNAYPYMAARSFPDPLWVHHPIRIRVAPADVPLNGAQENATVLMGRQHQFLVLPVSYLDGFLSQLVKAYPELKREVDDNRYTNHFPNQPFKDLLTLLMRKAREILASYGLPVIMRKE